QCMLIVPVVINLTHSITSVNSACLIETAKGLNFSKGKTAILMLTENKTALFSVVLSAFGRSIAEVGAVSLVGGNIQWKTRVMTTAIMLETNKGNFSFALALGIILLLISFTVNIIASFAVKEDKQ
ncbi:MAG: ABC transporter permease, partial [Clostridia bacterium]|nr:ABC transporter permease [Clostridia bacterium]